jgi:hypothetical protein
MQDGAALGAGGEGDAGNLGVVVQELEVLPGAVGGFFEEGAEGVELAEAELEGEEAFGFEGRVGGGKEAAVDVEALDAGEEGGVGFVLEDLVGHGGGFVEGDVGRVGDDDVEGWGGLELRGGEEIGLEEGDAVDQVVAGGVVFGDGEGGGVEVGGGDVGQGELGGKGECDGAGAGADVEDAGWGRSGAGGDPAEDSLDEEFGFGAGDEGVAGDTQHEAVELLMTDEVLDGFFGGAAGDEGAVGAEEGGGEFGVGVGDEPGAVAEEEMSEEGLGIAAIDGGGGFGEGFAEGHKGRV